VPQAVTQCGSDGCSWLCWLWAETSDGLQQFVAQVSAAREQVSSVEQGCPGVSVSILLILLVPSLQSLAVLKYSCEKKMQHHQNGGREEL